MAGSFLSEHLIYEVIKSVLISLFLKHSFWPSILYLHHFWEFLYYAFESNLWPCGLAFRYLDNNALTGQIPDLSKLTMLKLLWVCKHPNLHQFVTNPWCLVLVLVVHSLLNDCVQVWCLLLQQFVTRIINVSWSSCQACNTISSEHFLFVVNNNPKSESVTDSIASGNARHLENNALTGSIPDWLASLTSLQGL